VGTDDFFVDLLFFHRHLQCLVAFELKNDKFRPEHLGQLEFYLEALDRDVKLDFENPSIGILICREKNDEVVKYALSRSVSPAVIAEYETRLIPKRLLRDKLNEIYAVLESGEGE
jgi:RecB family endonuclease NucS